MKTGRESGRSRNRPVGHYQEEARAVKVFFNEISLALHLPVATGPVRVFVIRVTFSHRADDHKRSLLRGAEAPGECVLL